MSDKKLITLILAIFCLDKTYTAKDVTMKIVLTLIKVITGGLFGVWWLVDIIMICMDKYKVNPLDYFK